MTLSPVAAAPTPVRRRLRVRGVVQGVGFRPYVHGLATELRLAGHVGNDTAGVFIEVEGDPPAVDAFERRLVGERPPLARIDAVDVTTVAALGERMFRISESVAASQVRTFVAPDVAVCDDCLRELFDPADRRYRYPFVNCTNCGPRFTITVRLPYDRPNTTMAGFALCRACAREYHDPGDRRFHAQPVACPACGPRLWFDEPAAVTHGTDAALVAAQRALARGAAVAVKGLGGYHLACDARSHAAVASLRQRKHRAAKPLAVMVPDLAAAERLAVIDDDEAALLTSPQRPIVLLRRRADGALSPLVAPGNPFVGVLLPYTPLHHLLFHAVPGADAPVPDALVMTSGNLSDEPICHEDADARRRLGAIADAWLAHDRPIHLPCDDSVVRVVDGEVLPIRRSRGYAPLPLRLPFEASPGIAVGGELKNTFCVASGRDAWMSQHIGDMGSVETLGAFGRSARQFGEMYDVAVARVAADLHPGYQTRRWAEDHAEASDGHPVALVQHHHAHVAAVMAEHGVPDGERVIGCAFDGTGYGTDGAIWGGEVLVASYDEFERPHHLRYVPLPGGDAAIRKPYRAALAHLWAAGVEWTPDLAPVRAATPAERTVLQRQLERGVQCMPTSSMGRLFDAVSSLLDMRHVVSYEAQAAIELETASGGVDPGAACDYRFRCEDREIHAAPVLRALVDDLRVGRQVEAVAAGFHLAVARLIAEVADRLHRRTGIDRVALTGGVFQNVLLVRLARRELAARGFRVLTHRLVPPNDGGLALGQMAVAGRRAVSTGS
ncbi:MAG TPA: carbamoyltransferase HypF, partial [Acidimicrobiales bacterium]|nr:carbamoyltransferase HypF [Acidimicrobiales bacterium]